MLEVAVSVVQLITVTLFHQQGLELGFLQRFSGKKKKSQK